MVKFEPLDVFCQIYQVFVQGKGETEVHAYNLFDKMPAEIHEFFVLDCTFHTNYAFILFEGKLFFFFGTGGWGGA